MMAARNSAVVPPHTLVLGDDASDTTTLPPSDAVADLREAVSAISHFSSSKSSRSLRGDISFEKRRQKFLDKMRPVMIHLQKLGLADAKMEDVFVLVLQTCEDYLHHPDTEKCRSAKDAVCVELLKGLTKNDEVLCRQLISFVAHRLKKSTAWRRGRRVAKAIFFRVLEWLRIML